MEKLQDEVLEEISGGNETEYQEIIEYLRIHDPEGYARIMSAPPAARNVMMIRVLYDHGVPVLTCTDSCGHNIYGLGSYDANRKNKYDITGHASQAELMSMIREKIR